MKKSFLAICALAIGLMSCASQHVFQSDPPFRISEARVQNWTAGREAGGAGTRLTMRWNPYEPGAYSPDTLYFRGKVLVPEVEDTETGMLLVASYERMKWEKKDRIMSADSLQEVGNQPPMPLETPASIPFELKGDEAVLVYSRKADGERFYYKIRGIKELPPRTYPSRPEN